MLKTSNEIDMFFHKHRVDGLARKLAQYLVAYQLRFRRGCSHSLEFLARKFCVSENAVSKAFKMLRAVCVLHDGWERKRDKNGNGRKWRLIVIERSRLDGVRFASQAVALRACEALALAAKALGKIVTVKFSRQQQPSDISCSDEMALRDQERGRADRREPERRRSRPFSAPGAATVVKELPKTNYVSKFMRLHPEYSRNAE